MARAEPSSGSQGWEGVRAGRAAGREDRVLSLAFHPAWLFWGYFLSSGGSKGLHQELTARAASSATRCLRSEPPEHTAGSLRLYLASGCLHSEQPVGLSKNALPEDEKSGVRFHVFHSSGRSLITRLPLLGLPLLVAQSLVLCRAVAGGSLERAAPGSSGAVGAATRRGAAPTAQEASSFLQRVGRAGHGEQGTSSSVSGLGRAPGPPCRLCLSQLRTLLAVACPWSLLSPRDHHVQPSPSLTCATDAFLFQNRTSRLSSLSCP